MNTVEPLDYWRLCDELSVIQATLLLLGIDPSSETGYCDGWQTHERPRGYEATKTALTNAILSRKLPAKIRRATWERGWDEEPSDGARFTTNVTVVANESPLPEEARYLERRGVLYHVEPDWRLTTVQVDELREWLGSRGVKTGFFFPNSVDAPDYLDKDHPRYAAKLAAAVQAWLAVHDASGRSPKQALEKWLRENAAKFDLCDETGKPNEQGIRECSKVANWKPEGGAPTTPAQSSLRKSPGSARRRLPNEPV